MSTPREKVAETLGRAIDGQIFKLNAERAQLALAASRIAEIDTELSQLLVEKARIDPERPSRTTKV